MDKLKTAFLEMHQIEEEEYNKMHGVSGWVLRNIPKLSQEMWDDLLDRAGEDNYKIISASTGDVCIKDGKAVRCDPWIRGDVIFSPDAVVNLKRSIGKETQ